MKQFATYLRVSTQKQGRSGLGLDAQRKMCNDFIQQHGGSIVREFIDVESGTHRDRKGLQDAMAFCKSSGCPLVIAKLDRLARDVEFCFKVVNTGIEIHFTDMPQMNTLLLGVFAAVAQYERELTSDRTKKALAVKKLQGCKLGAANDVYKANRINKDKKLIEEEMRKKGMTRNRRKMESRDFQAMLRILRRVFPDATKNEDPRLWDWGKIGTRNGAKDTIYQMMVDYKEMDESGSTFHGWDFASVLSDGRKAQQKLGAYIQAIRNTTYYSTNNN